ncbi:hypothetical protein [Actinomadura sp. NPDC048394]|uniref:hypothetical protein n=1 Tax=Actinomadura sp. NPDC048394 TaxID=3158223 RepID=UPI003409FC42
MEQFTEDERAAGTGAASAAPSAGLTDYAIDVIAMVCLHALAPSEEEALQKVLGVQGASMDGVILPDGVTATELSVRHASGIAYAYDRDGADVPVTYARTRHADSLTRLADACEQAAAAFRAIADSESGTFDGEYDAAMDMADKGDLLVEEVRKLLADVESDIL